MIASKPPGWPGHDTLPTIESTDAYITRWEGPQVRDEYVKDASFQTLKHSESLSKRKYSRMRFRNVVFANLSLDDALFACCVFEGCSFFFCTLNDTQFHECVFEKCDWKSLNWEGHPIAIEGCEFLNSRIYDCNSSVDGGTCLINDTQFKNTSVVHSFARWTDFYRGNEGVVDAGRDARGYRFMGYWYANAWHIAAGCRWYDKEEALSHWGPDDRANKDAMRRVRLILATSKPDYSMLLLRSTRECVPEATP